IIKIFQYCIFVLTFLVFSCSEKNQNDRNVSGIKKPGKTYNERLAGQTFQKYCAVCHGTKGKGDGINALNLDPCPPDFTDVEYMNLLTHEYLVQAISEGGQKINKSPLMPAWRHTFTNDEVQRLATYVSNFGSVSQE
ncbi:MAG: cytochrome c, partial [Bacteroidota bacterium]|nr:cytochrome c [Bacteroidota bacterium]